MAYDPNEPVWCCDDGTDDDPVWLSALGFLILLILFVSLAVVVVILVF